MSHNQVDLANIFGVVTQALAENKQSLNQADQYNQDHGNNMVQTFETITQALQQKQGSSNSTALKYAAKQLSKKVSSSSGQLYAQHLNEAANQFKGKEVDSRGALELLQTLIGGGQASQSASQQSSGDPLGILLNSLNTGTQTNQQPTSQNSGDLLGSLLGGLTGGDTSQQQSTTSGEDLMSSLLGGLSGNQGSNTAEQGGFGMQDLLNAGMAYFQAKQQGGSTMQAAAQAFMAGSGMGNNPHRQQSTAVVVNSFLQALGALNKQ